MPTLFDPLRIGDLEVPNRVFLAPLTRNRSTGPGRVPNALMRDYYAQRASAGLIISEATSVAPAGVGYPHTPGIWSDEQVEGWRKIVRRRARGRRAHASSSSGMSGASPIPSITTARFPLAQARSRRRAM